MEIKVKKNEDGVYLLELSGALDLYSSEQLKALVMKLLAGRMERLIVNLKKVDRVNSSGLGALINVSSTLKKLSCPFVIVADDCPVLSALEETRLSNFFKIAPTLKEALAL